MDYIIVLYGLIFHCPFKAENHLCPFREIRHKDIGCRVKILDEMDDTK